MTPKYIILLLQVSFACICTYVWRERERIRMIVLVVIWMGVGATIDCAWELSEKMSSVGKWMNKLWYEILFSSKKK